MSDNSNTHELHEQNNEKKHTDKKHKTDHAQERHSGKNNQDHSGAHGSSNEEIVDENSGGA